MAASPAYLSPSSAAERLGVSASGLRRLAAIYTPLYGELPRDTADNRLWPLEAVERLEAARALVQTGRARSIKEALQDVDRGVDVPVVDLAPPPSSTLDALKERLEALAALPARVEELDTRQTQRLELLQDTVIDLLATVSELHAKLNGMTKALEAPKDDGKAAYIAEMEAMHATLERRHQYLLGELERRRKAEERKGKRQLWWKWWSRG